MTLEYFFREEQKAAVAFSGGVDSAYLLSCAVKYGADVRAYYIRTQFQPDFELDDARRLADELGIEMTVIGMNVLSDENITANPSDRCYHCKKRLFSAILEAARADGYDLVLDGNNSSDAEDDRPGMRAVRELGVRSPLRECGLTKADIRELSRRDGLFTWDKPAYACLATRIPTGEVITAEKLRTTDLAEQRLRSMGFSNLRVRLRNGNGLIQLPKSQLERGKEMIEQIKHELAELYPSVSLDPEGR